MQYIWIIIILHSYQMGFRVTQYFLRHTICDFVNFLYKLNWGLWGNDILFEYSYQCAKLQIFIASLFVTQFSSKQFINFKCATFPPQAGLKQLGFIAQSCVMNASVSFIIVFLFKVRAIMLLSTFNGTLSDEINSNCFKPACGGK